MKGVIPSAVEACQTPPKMARSVLKKIGNRKVLQWRFQEWKA